MAVEVADKPRVIVTGATRGVGKEFALAASQLEFDGQRPEIILTYNSKERRAQDTKAEIEASGGTATIVQVDVTRPDHRERLLGVATRPGGYPLILDLNAAGGLELKQEAHWARKFNVDAQIAMVNDFRPHMRPGSKILYPPSIYSHAIRPAEFNGMRRVNQPPLYRMVAETKFQCESALRAMEPELQADGIAVYYAVGQLLEGTGAFMIFEKTNPDQVAQMKANAGGKVPHARDEAMAFIEMIRSDAPTGETRYVGGRGAEPMRGRDYRRYTIDDMELSDILYHYGPHTRKLDSFESPRDDKLTGIGRYRVREEDTVEHFMKQMRNGRIIDVHLLPGHWQLESALLALGVNFHTVEPNMDWIPLLWKTGNLEWSAPVKTGRVFETHTEITAITPAMIMGDCTGYVRGTKVFEGHDLTLRMAPEDKALAALAKAP